jgi:hypothetical protein
MDAYDRVWASVDGFCAVGDVLIACNQTCGLSISSLELGPSCFDVTTVLFCVDIRYNFFFIWGSFVVVILIVHLLSLFLCRSFMPSPITFLHNYVVSAFFSCVITGFYCAANRSGSFGVMTIIMIPFIWMILWCATVIGMNVSCSNESRLRPQSVMKAMSAPRVSRAGLLQRIANIRRSPPTLNLIAAIPTRKGTRINIQKQAYVSWEERCEEIELPSNGHLLILVDSQVEHTLELALAIDARRVAWTRELGGGVTQVVVSHAIEGTDKIFIGLDENRTSCFLSFAGNGCGNWIYVFLILMGLHSLYEAVFCAIVTPVVLKTVKWTSASNNFHCCAGESDIYAPTVKPPSQGL